LAVCRLRSRVFGCRFSVAMSKKRGRVTIEQLVVVKSSTEENPAKREADMIALRELEKKHKAVTEELESLAENDPAVYEAMEKASKVAHTAANRWTDNIYCT
jgi:hypothetical protein